MKKSLILSVVCLLAAVLTTTTASAQENGKWVQNSKDFPKRTAITKLRYKDNGGIKGASNRILIEFENGKQSQISVKGDKGFTIGNKKPQGLQTDEDGWMTYELEQPMYVNNPGESEMCYTNVQFYVEDSIEVWMPYSELRKLDGDIYSKIKFKKLRFEKDKNLKFSLKDEDDSYYEFRTPIHPYYNPQIGLKYITITFEQDMYLHSSGDFEIYYNRGQIKTMIDERNRKELERQQAEMERERQQQLAEEKRRQEEAAKEAEMEQLVNQYCVKYGVTNDEKGEEFKKVLREVLEYSKPTDLWYTSSNAWLGRMLMEGDGCKKNYAEALKYLNKALDNDSKYEIARYSLGHMYWNGLGVQQNRVKAAEYYDCIKTMNSPQYAENDRAIALYRAAQIYEQGINGVKNIDRAIIIYSTLAKASPIIIGSEVAPKDIISAASYKYAYYLEQGRTESIFGFPDIKKAREYYHKAFEYGDAQTKAKAKQALDRIGH